MASIDTLKLLNHSIFGESDPNPLPENSVPHPSPEFQPGSDPLAVENPNEGRELIEEMMGEQGEATGDVGLVNLPESGDSVAPLERTEVSGGVSTPVPVKSGYELALVATPDWLPHGWMTEIKVRSSGVTAGTRDKYFYDPVSNRRFRSRKEVFNFLQTGTLGRYKPKQKINGSDANTPGISVTPHRSYKPWRPTSSSSRQKSPLRFDFINPPSKVRWVFNGSESSWSPFIGNEELPESSKRAWVTALELHSDVLNSFQE